MGKAQQTGAVIDQFRQFTQHQSAVIRHRQYTDFNPRALCQHIPGHNIGVMFHLRDNDIVTIIAECATKTVCHQIDGFGGAFDKNNLFRLRRIDKRRRFLPHGFRGSRGLCT